MRVIKTIVFLLLTVVLSLSAYIGFGYADSRFGLIRDQISISGTGSMFPTFPKGVGTDSADLSRQTVVSVPMRRYPGGINLFNQPLFANELHRGDIISFENSLTDKLSQSKTGKTAGFVKRIIALPGDKLEIRDGFVYINGQIQMENYTASARSTFGGQFLPDCQTQTIPPGVVFVMGDNRKGSSDSRQELGLVPISDIDHLLSFPAQTPYATSWRDASGDSQQSLKPVLDKQLFLKLLNEKRSANKLPPLKYQPQLETSAGIRADVILKYDDLSFTATRSGITMATAMSQAGYSNIVWGEAPTLGYYTAEELLENFFEFPNSRSFLLNPDFQETGITAKVGTIHGCPVQIVVQHFAGYKPPDYSAQVIASWQKGLTNLQDTLPSWEKLKTYPTFYSAHQADIDELLGLFHTRLTRIQAIVTRMQANQWLNSQEEAWTRDDASLAKRMSELSSRLNSY
jgi:signal peptidase I